MRRIASLLSVLLLVFLPATAAHADPAGPTNYRSTLTTVPDVDGIEVSIYGGDAFLVLEVRPGAGHEVIVHGYAYDDEVVDAYLRFSSDGTVEANRRSPARWMNQDRYAAVELPDSVDPAAPPDWEVVATDGRFAWHDHRIHWMSSALPPTVDPGGGVQVVPALADWRIPIEVDGIAFELTGTLTWEPSPSPLPWAALALVLTAAVFALAARMARGPWWAILGAAVAALVVGAAATVGVPPGVGVTLPGVLLPLVSLVMVAAFRPRAGRERHALVAAAGLPLAAWALLQAGALTRPIVPSAMPVVAIRAVVVLAVASCLGAVAVAVARLFGTSLEDLAALADDP